MKIQAHDAHYSFDYIGWVNACFDVATKRYGIAKFTQGQWGISGEVLCKFWRYERVSLPTMLQIEFATEVQMINFVVKID